MADIFISYAREDRETAKMLAQALAGQRWSVWWDQHIPSGRRFDDFIAKQLQTARCVIVLWSTAAVRSEWVIEEAAEARERNVLTPALIDTVKPPLGFRHRQAVDLIGWQGDQNHPGFARLIEDITAVLGEPPAQVSQQEEAGGAAGEKSSRIAVRANPFRLRPSFNNGLYGGLIGGALAGLFIGVTYYAKFTELDKSITLAIMPPIFLYGSFSGLLLGAFIQLFILWFCYLVTEKQYSSLAFNEVTGGLLGGAIGGIPVGALAGLIFGFSHKYFVGHVELVIGSLFIAIFIAFGARFSEYRGLWQNIARAFIAALLITTCTATAGILILQLLNRRVVFLWNHQHSHDSGRSDSRCDDWHGVGTSSWTHSLSVSSMGGAMILHGWHCCKNLVVTGEGPLLRSDWIAVVRPAAAPQSTPAVRGAYLSRCNVPSRK